MKEYVVGLIVYKMGPQLAVTDEAVKTVLETGDFSTVVVMSLMKFEFQVGEVQGPALVSTISTLNV